MFILLSFVFAIVNGDPEVFRYSIYLAESRGSGVARTLDCRPIVHVFEFLWRREFDDIDLWTCYLTHWLAKRVLSILSSGVHRRTHPLQKTISNRLQGF